MGLKSWLFTVSIFISLTIPSYLFCQTTNISGIINTYTKVTNIITVVANCTTTSTITVVSPIGFNVGDKVMIAQMKGAIIDTTNTIGFGTITTYNNAGNFEFATIDSINGNDIVLKDPLGYTYTSSGFVQLVTVPQYNNAIVNATLTASPWNGNTGGILVFEASDSVTLDADINVDGLGFRGGVPSITTINCRTDYFYTLASGGGGQKGEGITDRKIAYEAGRGALANGGGGGNDHNSGGAGGGNYGSGGTGGNAIYHAGYNCLPNYMVGGKGGKALDYDSCRIFLGGGGGGGHWYNSVNGIKGMDGGGMIIISANEIIGNGYTISAEGMDQTISASIDGAGGGGAGGTIFITNQTYTDTLIITVNGGDGGDVSNNNKSYCHGAGGGGGGGIVWISSSSIPGNIITEVNGGTMGINTNSNAYFPCKGLPFGASDGQIGTVLTGLVFSTCSSPTTQNKEADLDTTICAGQSIQFSYDTSLVYDWTPGTYLNDSTIADPISNPSDSIVYQVITSDSCMNLDTFLISLNVKQLPVINLTTDTVICTYDSILLSASGGGTYLWSPS
ncbi:MAG: hypothetical protein IIA45_02525, partial [Bacteroidetes bacterium]|nr:hypothetical protein [Bacteroidota bacterium]